MSSIKDLRDFQDMYLLFEEMLNDENIDALIRKYYQEKHDSLIVMSKLIEGKR